MHVYGTSARLFINATLGCNSGCSYCYLPELGYETNSKSLKLKQSSALINEAINHASFKAGRNGTIISLGCYSECWDTNNKATTKEIINFFLNQGNPVQFATKRQVNSSDIEGLASRVLWEGQLSIFVSCSTVSLWDKIEKGTDAPNLRFSSFEITSKLGVPTYLYIKPVIKKVTISDLVHFKQALDRHPKTGVVVGRKFIKSNGETGYNLAPISDGKLIYSQADNDDEAIFKELNKNYTTYRESIHAVEYWRNNEKL